MGGGSACVRQPLGLRASLTPLFPPSLPAQGRPCQPGAGAEGSSGDPTGGPGAGGGGWGAPGWGVSRPGGRGLAARAHRRRGDPRGALFQCGHQSRQTGDTAGHHQVGAGRARVGAGGRDVAASRPPSPNEQRWGALKRVSLTPDPSAGPDERAELRKVDEGSQPSVNETGFHRPASFHHQFQGAAVRKGGQTRSNRKLSAPPFHLAQIGLCFSQCRPPAPIPANETCPARSRCSANACEMNV